MTSEAKKIIAFFIVCFLTLSLLFIKLNMDIELKEAEATTSQHTQYTIKEYNGRIAIFKNDNSSPESIYDTYISVLPESDQNKLKNGITVNDKKELQKLIEDYTS